MRTLPDFFWVQHHHRHRTATASAVWPVFVPKILPLFRLTLPVARSLAWSSSWLHMNCCNGGCCVELVLSSNLPSHRDREGYIWRFQCAFWDLEFGDSSEQKRFFCILFWASILTILEQRKDSFLRVRVRVPTKCLARCFASIYCT